MIKWLKSLLFLYTIASLFSCATVNVDREDRKTFSKSDPTIQAYVNDFLKKANTVLPKSKRIKLTSGFVEFKGDTVGECTTYTDHTGEIRIDRSAFDHYSEIQKRVLIFHEATHCFCGRKHTHKYGMYKASPVDPIGETDEKTLKHLGYYSDLCPTSIMYPRVLDADCALSHWADYEKEMLEGCQP